MTGSKRVVREVSDSNRFQINEYHTGAAQFEHRLSPLLCMKTVLLQRLYCLLQQMVTVQSVIQ